jgi:hypothetical protein
MLSRRAVPMLWHASLFLGFRPVGFFLLDFLFVFCFSVSNAFSCKKIGYFTISLSRYMIACRGCRCGFSASPISLYAGGAKKNTKNMIVISNNYSWRTGTCIIQTTWYRYQDGYLHIDISLATFVGLPPHPYYEKVATVYWRAFCAEVGFVSVYF